MLYAVLLLPNPMTQWLLTAAVLLLPMLCCMLYSATTNSMLYCCSTNYHFFAMYDSWLLFSLLCNFHSGKVSPWKKEKLVTRLAQKTWPVSRSRFQDSKTAPSKRSIFTFTSHFVGSRVFATHVPIQAGRHDISALVGDGYMHNITRSLGPHCKPELPRASQSIAGISVLFTASVAMARRSLNSYMIIFIIFTWSNVWVKTILPSTFIKHHPSNSVWGQLSTDVPSESSLTSPIYFVIEWQPRKMLLRGMVPTDFDRGFHHGLDVLAGIWRLHESAWNCGIWRDIRAHHMILPTILAQSISFLRNI